MKNRICWTFILSALVLSACSGEKQMERSTYSYDFDLNRIELGLDNTTVGRSTKFQTITDRDSIEYLAFLNEVNSTIKLYRLDSLAGPQRTIWFETQEGPNSIGGNLFFFEILNKDSILTYVEFAGGPMVMTNWEGEKIDVLELPIAELLETNYFPGFNTSSPIFKISGDRLLFPYSVSKLNTTGKSPLFVYNMRTRSVDFGLESLGFYSGLDAEKIGGKEFFKTSMTFNSKERVYVMIRPLDKNIYKVSENMELIQAYEVKDSYAKPFETLRQTRDNYRSAEKKYLYHRYVNSSYKSVIYDPWKNVYYRIITKGYNKEEIDLIVDKGQMIYGEFMINVFDEDFKRILDYPISSKDCLSHDEFFVSSKGLALKVLTNVDEDIMSFKTFSLVKK
jgi:hypothetical protein